MGGDSVVVGMVVLVVVGVVLIFWATQFLDLMGRDDNDFPGRYDKPIWAAILVLTGVLGAVLYVIANPQRKRGMGYRGQEDNARNSGAYQVRMDLHKAVALEKRGEFAEAIKQFEKVAEKAGEGHPNAAMARERIRLLQARLQDAGTEPGAAAERPRD